MGGREREPSEQEHENESDEQREQQDAECRAAEAVTPSLNHGLSHLPSRHHGGYLPSVFAVETS